MLLEEFFNLFVWLKETQYYDDTIAIHIQPFGAEADGAEQVDRPDQWMTVG